MTSVCPIIHIHIHIGYIYLDIYQSYHQAPHRPVEDIHTQIDHYSPVFLHQHLLSRSQFSIQTQNRYKLKEYGEDTLLFRFFPYLLSVFVLCLAIYLWSPQSHLQQPSQLSSLNFSINTHVRVNCLVLGSENVAPDLKTQSRLSLLCCFFPSLSFLPAPWLYLRLCVLPASPDYSSWELL